MQTLHAGCSKAEPKNFAPPQTHFPGAQDSQNLISWRWSLPLPTNPVCWGSMHAHTPHTNKNQLQNTVPQLASTQCNDGSSSSLWFSY